MPTPPGHKRSQHLIGAEAYRRIMAGGAPATLGAFAHADDSGSDRAPDPRNLGSPP